MKEILTLVNKKREFIIHKYLISVLCLLTILSNFCLLLNMADLINVIHIGIGEIKVKITKIIVICLINIIVTILQDYMWNNFEIKVSNDALLSQFKKTEKMNSIQLNEIENGEYIQRICEEAVIPVKIYWLSGISLFFNIIRILCILWLFIWKSIELTLICLISLPIYFLTNRILERKIEDATNNVNEHKNEYLSIISQCKEGCFTIKNLNVFKYFDSKIDKIINKNYYNSKNDLNKVNVIYGTINLFFVNILPVIILVFGGSMVGNGKIDLGTVFLFYSYFTYIVEPIHNINDAVISVKKAEVIAKRINKFNEKCTLEEKNKIFDEEIHKIEFKNVSIGYDNNPVLENINITFKQREYNLISGSNGIGKSSLMKSIFNNQLILGGCVYINDKTSVMYNLNCIHYISVNDPIFNISIDDNILLNRESNLIEEIYSLCEIDKLKQNLDKELLVSGIQSNISSGEKCLILLARALVGNPKAIIIDEIFSHLDCQKKVRLFNSIKNYCDSNNILMITISHDKEINEMYGVKILKGGANNE